MERAIGGVPEVAVVYSKTGIGEVASDPNLPGQTDTFIILKPRNRWPDPKLPKSDVVAKLDAELSKVPGSNYEYSQPIRARFNELLAGVKGDVAVKVFGDDFAALEKP